MTAVGVRRVLQDGRENLIDRRRSEMVGRFLFREINMISLGAILAPLLDLCIRLPTSGFRRGNMKRGFGFTAATPTLMACAVHESCDDVLSISH